MVEDPRVLSGNLLQLLNTQRKWTLWLFFQGRLGSERSWISFSFGFPDLCEKEAENNQHPVSKASCLMELVDTDTSNLKSSLSPSALKGSGPFQAASTHTTPCKDIDVTFQLHHLGEKLHTVPTIYWCRQESCLVPCVEFYLQSWPGDALSVPKEKPGARSGAATWASINGRP